MAEYNQDTFTYGVAVMRVTSMRPVKVPATIKQKIGSRVVELDVVGQTAHDYQLQVEGVVYQTSTTLAVARGEIEALDDGEPHALVDGIHDGNYIIQPGSLSWSDSSDDGPLVYRYSMRLIQKQ